MEALCKCTSLNLWRKAFRCITNTLKERSNIFYCKNSQYSIIVSLLSESDTSLATKQVVIGLWHHNWNNAWRDFGRHHLTFSHYTFQDVSFIFLFPWIDHLEEEWQTTAHRPNLAHCPFLYGLGAKNGFYIFEKI